MLLQAVSHSTDTGLAHQLSLYFNEVVQTFLLQLSTEPFQQQHEQVGSDSDSSFSGGVDFCFVCGAEEQGAEGVFGSCLQADQS